MHLIAFNVIHEVSYSVQNTVMCNIGIFNEKASFCNDDRTHRIIVNNDAR